METKTTLDGAAAVVAITGKLTVAEAPGLESALAELPADARDVTLDITGLDYVASAGLRVIVSYDKKARANGGSLRLLHPNEEVMDVFDATGLVDILEIVQ